MTDDFYDLLEIPSDASQDDVKEAYREKVRIYHPDLNDDDRAQAQFTAVKKAYDILGDPVERQAYDRLGHEDYVAKRTSGLPSPDVWKRDASSSSIADSEPSEPSTASRSGAGSAESSGASATSSATGATGAAGATAAGATATSTGTGSATGSATTDSNATAGGRGGGAATGSAAGGAARSAGTTAGRRTAPGTDADRFGDNAVVQWWRRQNFAWPLIWLSVLTYLAGLGHYGVRNGGALATVWAELAAIGAAPGELWTAVSTDQYGLRSPAEFVADVEPVAPPVDPTQWYGALAGVVVAALAVLLVVRVAYRRDTWGPVTIDETIVAAVAIGATTTLLGGPLLAGAILMPMLFGVIVSRTRQLPGWSPSYLYVALVSVPAIALLGDTVVDAILPIEFLAFVVLPIVGGLGLPLRASIRKRFGR